MNWRVRQYTDLSSEYDYSVCYSGVAASALKGAWCAYVCHQLDPWIDVIPQNKSFECCFSLGGIQKNT
jgi:hypothetical protein